MYLQVLAKLSLLVDDVTTAEVQHIDRLCELCHRSRNLFQTSLIIKLWWGLPVYLRAITSCPRPPATTTSSNCSGMCMFLGIKLR